MNSYSIADVVAVNLNPSIGQEQKKVRPCVVINLHPKLKLLTVFPITDAEGKSGKVFVSIKDIASAGLSKDSVIDTYQIRTLSIERVTKKLGQVSENEIFECRKSLALIFQIDEDHLI